MHAYGTMQQCCVMDFLSMLVPDFFPCKSSARHDHWSIDLIQLTSKSHNYVKATKAPTVYLLSLSTLHKVTFSYVIESTSESYDECLTLAWLLFRSAWYIFRIRCTSAFGDEHLYWSRHGIRGFAGVVSRVLRSRLRYGKLGLGSFHHRSSTSTPTGLSPVWRHNRHTSLCVVVYHSLVVIPKHVSVKKNRQHDLCRAEIHVDARYIRIDILPRLVNYRTPPNPEVSFWAIFMAPEKFTALTCFALFLPRNTEHKWVLQKTFILNGENGNICVTKQWQPLWKMFIHPTSLSHSILINFLFILFFGWWCATQRRLHFRMNLGWLLEATYFSMPEQSRITDMVTDKSQSVRFLGQ